MKTINCPACGGELALRSAATAMTPCSYCGQTLIVNQEVIRNAGRKAVLTETTTCLSVGWPAQLLGREIISLGRLQFKYAAGLWEEWWVQFVDDQSTCWISQDENEYMLEVEVKQLSTIPALQNCNPGNSVLLGTETFVVEERQEGTLVGFEGELPFPIMLDEQMTYVDLAQGEKKASINFFADGTTEVFKGRYLEIEDLEAILGDEV